MSVPSSAWFVGAQYNGNEDKTADFLSRGVWENGYADRYLDEVRGMKPGDRIAIKSSFVSKPGSIRQPGTPGKAVSTRETVGGCWWTGNRALSTGIGTSIRVGRLFGT
jgi:hypothetical protein